MQRKDRWILVGGTAVMSLLLSACSGGGVSSSAPTSTPTIDTSLMLGELPPLQYDANIRGLLPIEGSIWQAEGKFGDAVFEGVVLFGEEDECFQAVSYRPGSGISAPGREFQIVDMEVLNDARVEQQEVGNAEAWATVGAEAFQSSFLGRVQKETKATSEIGYPYPGVCSVSLLPYIAKIVGEEFTEEGEIVTALELDRERYELLLAHSDRAWLRKELAQDGVPPGEVAAEIYEYEKKRPQWWDESMKDIAFTVSTNGLNWSFTEKDKKKITSSIILSPDESLIIKGSDTEKTS